MPYTIAIVCLNGHILTYDTNKNPDYSTINHCPKCGTELICSCPSCNYPIHGREIKKGTATYFKTPPDSFCYNCGVPYPWTEFTLENAEMIINELDCLSEQDREKLNRSFKDLIAETPKTPYAILLAKKALSACTGFLKESLVNLILSSACESVKKELGF